MDEFVKKILEQWNMYETMGTYFDEHKVDEETFTILSKEDLKEIIPPVGQRKKFEIKYEEFRRDTESNTFVLSPISSSSTSTVEETFTNLIEISYPQRATVGLPYEVNLQRFPATSTVQKLIESTEEGKLISASYMNRGTSFLRGKLAELIVRHELKNSSDKRISCQRFRQLADEINTLFLHERPEIYYQAYVRGKDNHPKAARGKLYSAYIYLRKLYKHHGLLKANTEGLSESEATSDGDRENLDDIQWLKNNNNPFAEVEDKWKNSTRTRMKLLDNIDINVYMDDFPGLKEPLGYRLFQIDFDNLYLEARNNFFNKWPLIAQSIIDIGKQKKDSYIRNLIDEHSQSDNDGTQQILALLVLPLILSGVNIKSKVRGLHWRPSKVEIKEGFILFVNSADDIRRSLEERQLKLQRFRLTAQPIPIIVAETIKNINASYICINDYLYKVETPLKAVDTCFKCFHALQAQYSKECENVWLFLQKFVYGITTKDDKKYVCVEQLISDLSHIN